MGVALAVGQRRQQGAGAGQFGLDGPLVAGGGVPAAGEFGEGGGGLGALLGEEALGLGEAVEFTGPAQADPVQGGGLLQVLLGVGGEDQLQRRVDAAAAVLGPGERAEGAAHGVDPVLAACHPVLGAAEFGAQGAGALVGLVERLRGPLGLGEQPLHGGAGGGSSGLASAGAAPPSVAAAVAAAADSAVAAVTPLAWRAVCDVPVCRWDPTGSRSPLR
ncbi:hypothetical protein ACFQVA_08935 [Actinomadura keratinilytica]